MPDNTPDPFPWDEALTEDRPDVVIDGIATDPPDPLVEEGRQLASEREDLIAAGADPAELAVPLAPPPTEPDRDADVEEWRSFARGLGYAGPDVDEANRSQIRTMLGIPHGEPRDAVETTPDPTRPGASVHDVDGEIAVDELAVLPPVTPSTPLDPAQRLAEVRAEADVAEVAQAAAEVGSTPVQWIGIEGVEASLENLAEPNKRREVTRAAIDTILNAVRTRADRRAKARPDKVRHVEDLRLELVGAGDDAEILDDLGRVFTTGATEARKIAGDLLGELPSRGAGPRRSAKVADGLGYELKVSASVRTETKVKHETLDDVLVAWLLLVAEGKVGTDAEPDPVMKLGQMPAKTYAAGARDALVTLRSLLGASPPYRSTALEQLVKAMGSASQDDLAKRLRDAYGKVEKGEPSIKLERTVIEPEPATAEEDRDESEVPGQGPPGHGPYDEAGETGE